MLVAIIHVYFMLAVKTPRHYDIERRTGRTVEYVTKHGTHTRMTIPWILLTQALNKTQPFLARTLQK